MKKIAIILTSLLLANTAMAGAVETVSYRCIGKKPVMVTYDLGGETQATAKIRLDGHLRTLVYSVDESNTESMTFKKGHTHCLHRASAISARPKACLLPRIPTRS